ncbi:MAG TPA: histidine kinase [Acidimicrobiia bacterium]|nr:histidine kinase [Acidimicrobiia bacterium]
MRLRTLVQRHAVDGAVVVLGAVWQLANWVEGHGLAAVAAAFFGTVPLLARRRFPFAGPALVTAGLAGASLADPAAAANGEILSEFSLVSLGLAFWFAGAHSKGEQAFAGVVIGLAGVTAAGRSAGLEFVVTTTQSELGLLGVLLLLGAVSLGGFASQGRARRLLELEERSARLEQEQERRTQAAVTKERARIAGDLHDVIAHSVSGMTIQAGAARLLLIGDQAERARVPLLSIEETGRQALAEMRRLLGLLRTDAATRWAVGPDRPTRSEPGRRSRVDRIRGEGLTATGFASLLRRFSLDVVLVVLVIVAEIKAWQMPGPGPRAVFIVASLLWTLPLLLRRRLPFAAPVFAFMVQAASAFADPTLGAEATALAALLLAFWVVGACNPKGQAIAGAVIGFGSIVIVAQVDVRIGLEQAVWGMVFGGTVCLIAYALQRRTIRSAELEEGAARILRERKELAQLAVAAERQQIARELHDVVAHSVTVMTVQAGAARLLLAADPDRALEPVLTVEQTGRQALGELRRLLGILGMGNGSALEPQPGLAQLDTLAEETRKAGNPVELTVVGESDPLPPGIDLAAYRIVQEALTNVRKHAGPTQAHVTVRHRREALELEITNQGGYTQIGPTGGHGLVGMRERVALYRGQLEAGPQTTGGFAVRVRLPREEDQP